MKEGDVVDQCPHFFLSLLSVKSQQLLDGPTDTKINTRHLHTNRLLFKKNFSSLQKMNDVIFGAHL